MKTKVLILCGGQGTRIREVSEILPKPMLTIGERPILWHIMKIYSYYSLNDFVLCLGYKGWLIKEFFLNYQAKISDITLNLNQKNSVSYHNKNHESDWQVTLADTGTETYTGTRIYNARDYLKDCDLFCVTYGDGVADINIKKLIEAHKKSGLLATLTGVKPLGRFGEIEIKGSHITEFNEKPNVSSGLINGGFMVFDKKVLGKYFSAGENLSLEGDILPRLVKDKQVGLYPHQGMWQCVDTPREFDYLNQLWQSNKAFWKIW